MAKPIIVNIPIGSSRKITPKIVGTINAYELINDESESEPVSMALSINHKAQKYVIEKPAE